MIAHRRLATGSQRRRWGSSAKALLAVGALAAVLATGTPAQAAPAAPAQACDPDGYPGCPPISVPPAPAVACDFGFDGTLGPGASVRAGVRGVAGGSQVWLTLNGAVLATATVAGGPDELGDGELSAVLPTDLEVGRYQVAAVGPGFTALCDPGFEVRARVMGASLPLPRTGTEIALVLAVGLALLVAGAALVRASGARRRRRRAAAKAAYGERMRRQRQERLAAMGRPDGR